MAITSPNNSVNIVCAGSDVEFEGYSIEPTASPEIWLVTRPDGTTYNIDICTALAQCVIDNLPDVDTATTPPTDGQVLAWNNANGMWEPADAPAANTSVVTQTVTAGNTLGTHDDGTGVTTDVIETVTTLVDNGDGTFTYTNEGGVATIYDYAEVYEGTEGTVPANPDVTSIPNLAYDPTTGNVAYVWDVTGGAWVATATGGGTTSVTTNLQPLSALAVQGVATHSDGNGVSTDIEETITTITNNGNNTFTYRSENNTATTWTRPALSVANCGNHNINVPQGPGTTSSPNRSITIPTTGTYILDYGMTVTGIGGGFVSVLRNGAVLADTQTGADLGAGSSLTRTIVRNFTAGDVLALRFQNESPNALLPNITRVCLRSALLRVL